jgi:hypothetical protein
MMKKNYGFVFAVLMLALAILACGGTPATTLPDNVLFQDDFSRTSSGWDRVNVDDGMTDYDNGVYRIVVNTDNTDVWANPGLSFTDVRIEVSATKAGGPDDNDFGVICRYMDENNWYSLIISSDGYYAIVKVKDGYQELLGMSEMGYSDAINQGAATNTVRADCIGSTLTLYANGTQLVSVTDSDFASGDVGLLAGTFDVIGTDITFDNFTVYKP